MAEAAEVQAWPRRKAMNGFISLGKGIGLLGSFRSRPGVGSTTKTYADFLTERDQAYAPDQGSVLCLSEDDLARFQAIFGTTGSGMSCRLIRPIALQWLERRERIQRKWDARKARMRHERETAQAIGPSRRQGRL